MQENELNQGQLNLHLTVQVTSQLPQQMKLVCTVPFALGRDPRVLDPAREPHPSARFFFQASSPSLPTVLPSRALSFFIMRAQSRTHER